MDVLDIFWCLCSIFKSTSAGQSDGISVSEEAAADDLASWARNGNKMSFLSQVCKCQEDIPQTTELSPFGEKCCGLG